YALHFDRIKADFEAERQRLQKEIAAVFSLSARYQWLHQLVTYLHREKKERLAEIDAEWKTLRDLKSKLQELRNNSNKDSIARAARTVLHIWQTPVKVPAGL